jgi:hypothetical protein
MRAGELSSDAQSRELIKKRQTCLKMNADMRTSLREINGGTLRESALALKLGASAITTQYCCSLMNQCYLINFFGASGEER